MSRQVRVWDEGKKTMVYAGLIVGEEFHRDVKPRHFMRVYQGYGLQMTAINILLQAKVKMVVLHHSDGYTLTSALWAWLEQDVPVANYGNGQQRFLSQSRMTRSADVHNDERLF